MNAKALNQSHTNAISDDDFTLFHQAINGPQGKTVRIKQDKIHPSKAPSKKKQPFNQANSKQRHAAFFFSEEFEPELSVHGPQSYVQAGKDTYLAKQLRRGDFYPDITLDLHGCNKVTAKSELAGLIEHCLRKHLSCACVIHGLGQYILKQKIPHYLVQHPAVLAFHEAPKQWGGKSALLVLFDIPDR